MTILTPAFVFISYRAVYHKKELSFIPIFSFIHLYKIGLMSPYFIQCVVILFWLSFAVQPIIQKSSGLRQQHLFCYLSQCLWAKSLEGLTLAQDPSGGWSQTTARLVGGTRRLRACWVSLSLSSCSRRDSPRGLPTLAHPGSLTGEWLWDGQAVCTAVSDPASEVEDLSLFMTKPLEAM